MISKTAKPNDAHLYLAKLEKAKELKAEKVIVLENNTYRILDLK